MNNEFKKNNLNEWEEALKEIFKGPIPDSRTWTDKKEIIRALYFLGRNPDINQIYLPEGGRHNLKRGEESSELDCLDLHFVDHPVCIVKPRALTFQSFGRAYEWAYFRLETKTLEPSGWYANLKGIKEELTEISPGDYADRKYWDLGSYEYDETGREIPLSSRARIVFRYFSGAWVIFSKDSPYPELSESSAGSPFEMTEEAFKEYIGEKVRLFGGKVLIQNYKS
jgi:hypothetical protein